MKRLFAVIAARRRRSLHLSGLLIAVAIIGGTFFTPFIYLISLSVVIAWIALLTWIGEAPACSRRRFRWRHLVMVVLIVLSLTVTDRWFPAQRPVAFTVTFFGSLVWEYAVLIRARLAWSRD